jgi:uncharacterized protein with HEPN domain
MPEKRDYALYINDILDAMKNIDSYTRAMTSKEFVKDKKTRDAVIRNLEVIGEAVKNIPDSLKKRYPDVNWKAAAGMRDKLIHEYFGVSHSIVWETIKTDLPALKKDVRKISMDLKRKPD